MPIIEVGDIHAPELAPYVGLTGREQRRDEIFVAESPKVIERALEARITPLSLLCENKHVIGDAAQIIHDFPELPVYVGKRDVLEKLTGYTLTRGVLCAMRRPSPLDEDSMLKDARRICVIYDVCDSTNVGVIFRSAAALGFDGIVLSAESCDPLNRRVIRVSMGTVFQISWLTSANPLETLHSRNFVTAAAALTSESIYLQDFRVEPCKKYALVLGSEGYGLPGSVISACSHTIKIPMHHNVDSLNVGAAAAILLWHFRP